jgi:DNA-binding transcriptional MerR regulator
MRTMKTSEAAFLLNVSPNTLRAWERRFGFPRPRRSPGRQRLYSQAEITALGDALGEGLSISSAVSVARDRHGGDVHTLLSALSSFRADRADEAIESSLALRSVERSIEEMMLPALDGIRRRQGATSAAWAFAEAWSEDWLLRARRLAPRLTRRGAVLIGDASAPPLDPARPYLFALELCCLRAGLEVLTLPVCAPRHLREAVTSLDPTAVVIAGGNASDDEVAAWAYALRSAGARLPLGLYHRRLEPRSARTRALVLPAAPLGALAVLLEAVDRIEEARSNGNANGNGATPDLLGEFDAVGAWPGPSHAANGAAHGPAVIG